MNLNRRKMIGVSLAGVGSLIFTPTYALAKAAAMPVPPVNIDEVNGFNCQIVNSEVHLTIFRFPNEDLHLIGEKAIEATRFIMKEWKAVANIGAKQPSLLEESLQEMGILEPIKPITEMPITCIQYKGVDCP